MVDATSCGGPAVLLRLTLMEATGWAPEEATPWPAFMRKTPDCGLALCWLLPTWM